MNTNNKMVLVADMASAQEKGDTMNDTMYGTMPVMQPDEIYERFAAAMNGNNLGGVMQLFDTNGATIPHPGATAIAGMDGIRGVMAQCLAMQPHIVYDNSHVIVADDIALLRSTWRLNVTGPDSKPVEVMGKGVQVARRQMDGSWRILIDNPWCAE